MPTGGSSPVYYFSEAFDILGQRLFGLEWRSSDIYQRTAIDPEKVKAEHAPYQKAVDDLDAQTDALEARIGATVKDQDIARLRMERDAFIEQRVKAIDARSKHPAPQEHIYHDWAAYKRHETTTEYLIGALASNTIIAYGRRTRIIPDYCWNGERHFWFDIELSLARLPRSIDTRRPMSVRLPKDQFNDWLAKVTPLVPSAGQKISPGLRCQHFLERAVREAPDGAPQMPKRAYLEEARASIPDLSEREFNKCWAIATPDSWKARGRRRRTD
jgi:hypothetical protein